MERDSKPFDCRDPIPLLVALKSFRPECALATGKAVGLVSCLPVNAPEEGYYSLSSLRRCSTSFALTLSMTYILEGPG